MNLKSSLKKKFGRVPHYISIATIVAGTSITSINTANADNIGAALTWNDETGAAVFDQNSGTLTIIAPATNEGVEKVIINTENFSNNKLVEKIAKKFGSQSAVVSIDVKKIGDEFKIFSNNGEIIQNCNLIDFINDIQDMGAGEIILTSIDNEGLKKGLDLDLYKYVEDHVKIPLIANGGVSSIKDILDFFDNLSFSAVACGALFVFFGERNAVLINYPDKQSIETIMSKYE